MATSMARTRLLKIVRLRPADHPFSGVFSRIWPTAGISPVSMRSFGPLSNMAVEHHPEEVDPRVEQGVGEASGHALRGARRVHDQQNTVERTPEVRGVEHLARHRRVEEDDVPALPEIPDGLDEPRRVRENPRARQARQDWTGRDDSQVGRHLETIVFETTTPLQGAGEPGEVRSSEGAMQVWPVQVAIHDSDLSACGSERRSQAEADRGPSYPRLRAGDDHALCRSPQSVE